MINTMKKSLLSILLFSACIANAANSYNILDVAAGGASGGSPITGCSTPSKILFIDPSINLDCTNGPTYDSGSNTATLNINGTVGATTPATVTATSVTDSGLTATRIPFAGTGGLLGDSANLTYDSTNVRVAVGAGGTTAQGWLLGYGGSPGESRQWTTGVIPASNNYKLSANNNDLRINSSNVYILDGGGSNAKIFQSGTAGVGPSITAGTNAAAATTYLIDGSQTLNNVAAAGGIRISQIQTLMSASANLLDFEGGTSGTTPRFVIGGLGTVIAPGLTTATGTPGSICYNTATNEITRNNALTCTISSARFKDNIYAYDRTALSVVDSVVPATFNYKDHPERNRIGFIAEQLASVDKRLAEVDSDGSPNSIDIPALLGVAFKAIQELNAKVDGRLSETKTLAY